MGWLSSPLVLWLRPRSVVQHAQVLLDPTAIGSGARARTLCPLYAITGTLLAAALGYSRRYRRMFFIQQCLFRHLRRVLLLLVQGKVEVCFRGIMPRLGAYWRILTRPAQELFLHPLSALPVVDVGVSRRLFDMAGGFHQSVARVLAGVTPLVPVAEADLAAITQGFQRQHSRAVESAFLSRVS